MGVVANHAAIAQALASARHMKHVQHWSDADKISLAVFHGWALQGGFG